MSAPDQNRAPVFRTTHWTRVLSARGKSTEAQLALSELCELYYAPVQAFITQARNGDASQAEELTQEFFAQLLARNGIDGVDPTKGRFRSFLLGAVKHFLADAHDRSSRLKRGGGVEVQSLHGETDSNGGIQWPDPSALLPDREFDRRWALAILGRALHQVELHHDKEGVSKTFQILKPWLTGDIGAMSQAEAANILGTNEGAIKVAIHRLRRRFRDMVKEEIGSTLNDPSLVQNELECLMAALRR